MPRQHLLATAAGGDLLLAQFLCPPDDPTWFEPNHISGGHVLAFPHRAVGIHIRGHSGVVADANRVVLYDPGSSYQRHLIDPAGDRCTYIGVQSSLLSTLQAPVLARGAGRGFLTDHVTVTPGVLLGLRRLAAALQGGDVDPLEAEDALLALALAVLRVPLLSGDDHRAATVRAHRRLVEDARAWIGAHHTGTWRLDDLAEALHVAPAHLHRVFRARTGSTIHEHRDRLRLAGALDDVLEGADDLSAVALDAGYSSHSHFTRRFRRLFGVTPSQVRDHGPGALPDADVSRIVTAAA